MDSQTRRKVRAVYGKKSTKNISASTAAVFLPTPDSSPAATKGTSVGPSISPPPSINVPDSSSDPASRTASTLTSVLQPIDRAPLDDITEALSNVKLNDDTKDPNVPPVQSTKPGNRVLRDKTRKAGKPHPVTATSDTLQADSRLKWLKPLLDAYSPEADGEQLEIQKWSDMGFDSCDLTKMAESSFAEVYKVMNDLGTSVLKIIALKPPSGPGSRRDTSSPVNDVISEVVIMNMMAEIYGFLEFKQAHLVEGKPSRPFVAAYDAFAIKKTTYFPHPSVYHNEQVFLVLELGDAGTDVENSVINQPSQLWDTFLGVTLAIATGETEFEFEHRDLHEGNVCLRRVHEDTSDLMTEKHRFGYSGLEITLLDYTLSRAYSNEQVIYRDLENDGLFEPSKILQNQMYCRMRTWAFWRAQGTTHPEFDSGTTPKDRSWEDYMPYNNVIWLWYLLDYTIKHYKGSQRSLNKFSTETAKLRHRLHPDTKALDGGFTSAWEVLKFSVESGWITSEEVGELDLWIPGEEAPR